MLQLQGNLKPSAVTFCQPAPLTPILLHFSEYINTQEYVMQYNWSVFILTHFAVPEQQGTRMIRNPEEH